MHLLFTMEMCNPNGSYEDRFVAAQVTEFLSRKVHVCVATSSGNTGASLAPVSARYGIACAVFVNGLWRPQRGRKLLIIGGSYWENEWKHWTEQVQSLDLRTNTWQNDISLPSPRRMRRPSLPGPGQINSAMTKLDGALYVLGGATPGRRGVENLCDTVRRPGSHIRSSRRTTFASVWNSWTRCSLVEPSCLRPEEHVLTWTCTRWVP